MLTEKTAVVTGANRGIGRCILETFLRQGCHVVACVRQKDADLEALLTALPAAEGSRLTVVELDLADEASIKSAVRQIVGSVPRLDILVNNAGVASGGLFQMSSMAEMRRVFEVNVFGTMQFSQGLARLMTRQKSGSIINIASTAVDFADPGTLGYGSSKAALVRMTQSMATELGAFNVRVNAIAPGLTRTDMFEQMTPAARELLIQRSALKRAAEPQDIANAALYLASDLSSFVTGQTLRVDGGMH
jgi:3-oxoacyl-[acyl-carrier protein] reductase